MGHRSHVDDYRILWRTKLVPPSRQRASSEDSSFSLQTQKEFPVMNHPPLAQPPDDPENSIGSGPFDRLAELVIERLALSLDVAAAKYLKGGPIDDPIREHQILESMTRELN